MKFSTWAMNISVRNLLWLILHRRLKSQGGYANRTKDNVEPWTTSLNLYDVLPPVLKLYHFELPFLVSRYHLPHIGLTGPSPCWWSMLQSLLDMLSVFWYVESFRTKALAPKLILYVFRTCLETAFMYLLVLDLNALDALCHLCCCKFNIQISPLRDQ